MLTRLQALRRTNGRAAVLIVGMPMPTPAARAAQPPTD